MRRILGFGLSVVIAGAVLAPAAGAQPGKGAPKPAASAKAAASAVPAAATAAATASAAPAPAPAAAGPASNVDQARAHFQTGSDLEKAGNVKGAYGEYKVAFGLYPHWQITGNLARTAARLGKHVEAAEMYRRVRDDGEAQKALSPEARADLEKNLADSQSKVAPLTVNAPAGAEVWVDGVLIGATPLSRAVPVDPGSHEVDLRQGVRSLKKLRVWTAPGKPAIADLSKVVVPGGGAAPQVSAAPVTTSTPEPDRPSGPSWAGVIGLSGAALAGAAVGVGLWFAADGKRSDAQKLFDALPDLEKGPCTTSACKAVHGALADQATFQTGAVIAWGIAGAAAAGAVAVYVFTRPGSSQKTGTVVAPVVGTSAGGFVVRGSF